MDDAFNDFLQTKANVLLIQKPVSWVILQIIHLFVFSSYIQMTKMLTQKTVSMINSRFNFVPADDWCA